MCLDTEPNVSLPYKSYKKRAALLKLLIEWMLEQKTENIFASEMLFFLLHAAFQFQIHLSSTVELKLFSLHKPFATNVLKGSLKVPIFRKRTPLAYCFLLSEAPHLANSSSSFQLVRCA